MSSIIPTIQFTNLYALSRIMHIINEIIVDSVFVKLENKITKK